MSTTATQTLILFNLPDSQFAFPSMNWLTFVLKILLEELN